MSGSVIISTTAVTAMFFLFLVGMGLKAQRTRPVTGMEGLIGEEGETQSNLDPSGTVWVHGEAWNAEAASGMIDKGKKVRVTGIKDLKLYVEQINSSA
jgi:membrane-bound serine protease (ClpP class)